MSLTLLYAFLISLAINIVVQTWFTKTPKSNIKAKGLDDFSFPTVSADRALPVVCGDVRMAGPNVTWFGDFMKKTLTDSVRQGLRTKKLKVGYEYRVGMELCLCCGLDEITEIWFGDELAWSGSVTDGELFTVSAPYLFGGSKHGGGVVSVARFYGGSSTQVADSYLTAQVGDAYAHRGIAKIVFYGPSYDGNSGYFGETGNIAAIKIRGRRILNPLGSGYANIAGDQNPAEMVYALMTGQYLPFGGAPVVPAITASAFDTDSFIAAATALYNENMGIQFQWQVDTPPDDIISDILTQIDAEVVEDPQSGLLVMKLMRADYDIATLPLFADDDIVEISSFGRNAINDTLNEFTANYTDKASKHKQTPLSVKDLGNMFAQSGHGSRSMDMQMLTNAAAVQRRATSELFQVSTPLAKAKMVLTRKARRLRPGDPFRVSSSINGIEEMVVRAGQITIGDLRARTIEVDVIEDVFKLGHTVYAEPPGSAWVDIHQAPMAATVQAVTEVPYPLLGGETPSQVLALVEQNGSAFAFDLLASINGAGYRDAAPDRIFMRSAVLAAPYVRETDDIDATGFTIDTVPSWISQTDQQVRNEFAGWMWFETDEWMAARGYTDNGDGTYTVTDVYRGMLDTVPIDHPAGTRVWFVDSIETAATPFVVGDNVDLKALTVTTKATLPEAAATVVSHTVTGRALQPWPPGNVSINGVHWPTAPITGDITVSAVPRDRTDGVLHAQSDSTTTAEPGSTTSVRVLSNNSGTELRLATGIALPWVYTSAMQSDDGASGAISLEVYSVRGSLTSRYRQVRQVTLA